MTKRTIAIELLVGAGIPAPENSWVEFRPTQRFASGSALNLPVASRVALVAGVGTASLDLTPSDNSWLWEARECIGGGAWITRKPFTFAVPAGTGSLSYSMLGGADPGPGSPEWGPVAAEARAARDQSVAAAAAAEESVEAAGEQVGIASVHAAAAQGSATLAAQHKAAVEAVVATNDGIMTAVAADPQSGFANQQEIIITAAVASSVAAVVGSAPSTLDTLEELSAALGSDPNFAASTAAALGNRIRFDAAQVLTAPQMAQATTNLGAATSAQVGDTAADFVAVFEIGLLS